ncbi:MAG: hypothetical protein ACKVPJ_06125 [Chitinophagales bacterium]
MKKIFFLYFILKIIFGFPTSVYANPSDSSEKDWQSEYQEFSESQDNSTLADSLLMHHEILMMERIKTDMAKERYFQQQYNSYYTGNLNHRENTFLWQYQSGKIIFWVVILIVIAGLIFSGMQFYITYKHMTGMIKTTNSLGTTDNTAETEQKSVVPDAINDMNKTDLSLSPEGLKINTSVIGLIILVISIAFFYLYLIHIYPIKEVNIDNKPFLNEAPGQTLDTETN